MIQDIKIAVLGNVDSSKCLARGTRVKMYDGTVKMVQDLLIGDLLMGDDFTARTILRLTSGSSQLYNINQSNGSRYTTTLNHILVLSNPNGEKVLISVIDYLQLSETERSKYKGICVDPPGTRCISIQEAYFGDYIGFELDKNKQFLLEDNTVTHNSTLIGTLIRGVNDDGRGANRGFVMNYTHELESGMTSSISYQILGIKNDSSFIEITSRLKKVAWPAIIKEANKLITFIDLAGHEKYLATTIHGLSCNHPDYALILIEGRGIRGMTKEHLMLAFSYDIPVIILITKIDLYTAELIADTIKQVYLLLKTARKEAWFIKELVDLDMSLQKHTTKFIPIFAISNVTGEGLDLFKNYLIKLPKKIDYSSVINLPAEASVLESFLVEGVGTVAHVFVVKGTIHKDDIVWIGPDEFGIYTRTKIRTIHYKRIAVDFVVAGVHCTVSLPGIDRNLLRKGVYLLHESVPMQDRLAVRNFTATVKIMTSHSITIQVGYCPVIDIDNVRMSAKMISIKDVNNGQTMPFIRGGEKAIVQFKFLYKPVYLRVDTMFIFREGKMCGCGKVTSIDRDIGIHRGQKDDIKKMKKDKRNKKRNNGKSTK